MLARGNVPLPHADTLNPPEAPEAEEREEERDGPADRPCTRSGDGRCAASSKANVPQRPPRSWNRCRAGAAGTDRLDDGSDAGCRTGARGAGLGQRHAPRGHPRRRASPAGRDRRSTVPRARGGAPRPASPPRWSSGTSFGAAFDRAAYTERGRAGARRTPGVETVAMAGFMTVLPRPPSSTFAGPHPQHPPVAAARLPGRARRAGRAGLRREGHGLHGPRGHRAGRRRADPGPGGRGRPAGRHEAVAARAHQGRRAPALPRRRHRGGAGVSDRAAVRLRQDRHRRAGRAACTSSAGGWCRAAARRKAIAEAGLPVTDVAELTGVPGHPRPPRRHAAPEGPRRAARRPRRARAPRRAGRATASSRSSSLVVNLTRSRRSPASS